MAKKPVITDKDIETLLNGYDPQEGLKYVDAGYYSNRVKLFYRKPGEKDTSCMEDTFRPFLWFKGFDFSKDFCWKTISVPVEHYEADTSMVLVDGKPEQIDDKAIRFEGFSKDEKSVFVSLFLPTIEERKKYAYKKYKEYGIQFSDTITCYEGQVPQARLENGFKTMVHIMPPAEGFNTSSNPLFQFNSKGKAKKITGSYSNLQDFFMEGGIDISKKSGIFLESDNFKQFWSTSSDYQKLFFYFSCFQFSSLFFDNDKINTECLQEFLAVNHNRTTTKTKALGELKELYHKNWDSLKEDAKKLIGCFDSEDEEGRQSSFIYNSDKITQIVIDEYSFEGKKNFKKFEQSLKDEGIDVFFGEERLFFTLPPTEQYMIQSGKRLFKGFEDYKDVRIMTMDIETEAQPIHSDYGAAALSPDYGRIFKIGIYQNDGYETVLTTSTDEEEIRAIEQMFEIIGEQKPEIFLTYNGESFDWPFILKRYQLLQNFKTEDDTIEAINELLSPYYDDMGVKIWKKKLFWRRSGNLKVGGASESYKQTHIMGINLCDTMFAVKRAAAINKSIPNNKLKDNIKHAGIAKPGRVYVEGSQIGNIMRDKSPYYLNEQNGDWFVKNKAIAFTDAFNISLIKKNTAGKSIYDKDDVLIVYDHLTDDSSLDMVENGICFHPYSLPVHAHQNYIDNFFIELNDKCKKYRLIVFHKHDFFGKQLPNIDIKPYLKIVREFYGNPGLLYSRDMSEYIETTGADIINRYLIDDLWETYKLDELYSQATFEIAKWLPSSYQRAATMGGASVWKFLLAGWSYHQNLAIPEMDEPRDFSGGLVGMTSTGWHGKSAKLDFSSMHISLFLMHCKNPKVDISGIYKVMVSYGLNTRLKYKALKAEHENFGNKELARKYDIKQLPLKILINIFYGMLGAATVSPFAELQAAQWITCNSRQYLRHTIKWFGQYGFKVINCHTDGVFFYMDNIDENHTYLGKGLNWLVESGKIYKGLAAYVAEYNDTFMKGVMGIDIDEVVESVISFAKGNYVYYKKKQNKKTGEFEDSLEFVGGGIKKKNQSQYIVNFVDDNLIELMKGNGAEFFKRYQKTREDIFDCHLLPSTIATKAKVKKSVPEYLEHIQKTNKNGKPLPKQAHMELLIQNNINPDVGEWVYYINTGVDAKKRDSSKTKETIGKLNLEKTSLDSDLFNALIQLKNWKAISELLITEHEYGNLTTTRKMTPAQFADVFLDCSTLESIDMKYDKQIRGEFLIFSKVNFELNCQLINVDSTEKVLYNGELYLQKFNNALEPLFLCYDETIRAIHDAKIETIMEDRKPKKVLPSAPFLTSQSLNLVNNKPFGKYRQDTIEELLELEPEEVLHWQEVSLEHGYDENSFLFEKDLI